ncbi:MAG: exo-alpha-sialidase [Paracoccaceae bacterium]|nr:exo-alpha-sialidase [Paracoccaceae bacterium]
MEPALFGIEDGGLVMSWTEPDGGGFAVKTAMLRGGNWSTPVTVTTSNSLFVNWADFPTIAAFTDGTLAVSWLQESAQISYSYDINIVLSHDAGQTWGAPIQPHDDQSMRQHGFLTLLPTAQDEMLAVWLDARGYNSQDVGGGFDNAVQLRSTTIGKDGTRGRDTPLDLRACSCCQTSASITGDGTILVAYRDRTADEIRDISIVRRHNGVWSDPVNIHADGWEISGCPVNGPAIDAQANNAVVAWFTGADDIPTVKVVFSEDSGATFGTAFQVDTGDGVGRVSTLMLANGEALISWVDWTDDGEALMLCRATRNEGCVARQTITKHAVSGSFNFPKLERSGDTIYLAWTQPMDAGTDLSTVRMVTFTD